MGTMPQLRYGWICPLCSTVYAPYVFECAACKQKSEKAESDNSRRQKTYNAEISSDSKNA